MTVNELFNEARKRIVVPDDVLKEARKQRDEIRDIVEEEFDTLRTFGSGSLAHGTQNDPLNDADAGVVLDRRVYEGLGSGGDGPCAVLEEVWGVLRTRLQDEYPNVRFYTGGHRAIRINFMEPIQPEDDNFTADLIVCGHPILKSRLTYSRRQCSSVCSRNTPRWTTATPKAW